MVSRVRGLAHGAYEQLIGGYQNRALNLLLLMFVIDYGERTLIGGLGPTLKDAFGIGNFRLGLLSAAFLFVAAAAGIPLGILADRVSRTAMLAACFVLWAVAVGLEGASSVFAMFFGFRLLVGIVSAVSGPTMPSLTGDIVSADRRGAALGRISTGVLLGLGVGYVLPVVVTAIFPSWRWAFWILAVAGACLGFAFWRLKEPERTGTTGQAEEGDEGGESREHQIVREKQIEPSSRAMLDHDPSEMSMWEAAKYTVRVRTDLIALISRSIGDFFLQGLATFVIVFVTGWYGLSQTTANIAVLGVGIGALAGVLVEGRISDALLSRGRMNGKIWVGSLGYMISFAAFFPAFFTHSLWIALPLFFVGAFFLAGARPPLDAVRIDVLVPELRGRAESIRQVVRSIAEGIAPAVIGALSTTLAGGGTKGLQLAFLIVLPALLLNGLIMLIALRTYQPDVAAAIASAEGERSSRRDEGSSG